MERIIIFRFHKNPKVCKNRLELLRHYNPKTRMIGLYGGEEAEYDKFQKSLKPYLEEIHSIENKSPRWKWSNPDLALVDWYKTRGKDVSFDMLHLIEWDLVIFDSLDNAYKGIPKNGLGLTALRPLKGVEHKWSWTSGGEKRKEWLKLLKFVKEEFNYNQENYVCLGPGPCMPKSFLEKYSEIKIPELCHDEIRLPLFGQTLGFKLYDTGFKKEWYSKKDDSFFNCMREEISLDVINRELKKKSGRRVFHPYSKIIKPVLS